MADRDYRRLYPVARAVLTPIFKFSWRVYTTGLEHLPSRGPAVICPNHVSVLDSFFLPLVLPRHLHLRGQGGVPRRLEDPLPLPRPRDDPHRQGWIGGPGGAPRRPHACSSRASCSAYIPRHEARRAAPPGPHGRRPVSLHRRPDRPRRDGGHPATSSRPTPRCLVPSGRSGSTSAGRST